MHHIVSMKYVFILEKCWSARAQMSCKTCEWVGNWSHNFL